MSTFDPSSRSRLRKGAKRHFVGESLFARLGRAVCEAECLPRKELFEAWEVARRVRRRFRGGVVFDLAAGHGLLAYVLLLLDDTSPEAICVDPRRPLSASRLTEPLLERWPRLAGRVRYLEQPIESVEIPLGALLASVHACGGLTDQVLQAAVRARARVAVLPCCHDLERCDDGQLRGWLEGPLAVDATRALWLGQQGYAVHTATIPPTITAHNRLLLGAPS